MNGKYARQIEEIYPSTKSEIEVLILKHFIES